MNSRNEIGNLHSLMKKEGRRVSVSPVRVVKGGRVGVERRIKGLSEESSRKQIERNISVLRKVKESKEVIDERKEGERRPAVR